MKLSLIFAAVLLIMAMLGVYECNAVKVWLINHLPLFSLYCTHIYTFYMQEIPPKCSCPKNYYLANKVCRCTAYPSPRCSGHYIWNRNTCRCEWVAICPRRPCPTGYYWSYSYCTCVRTVFPPPWDQTVHMRWYYVISSTIPSYSLIKLASIQTDFSWFTAWNFVNTMKFNRNALLSAIWSYMYWSIKKEVLIVLSRMVITHNNVSQYKFIIMIDCLKLCKHVEINLTHQKYNVDFSTYNLKAIILL